MTHSTTHVSSKYQLVIPKSIRKMIKLKPLQEFIIYVQDDNTIVLKKEAPSIKKLKGSGSFLDKDYLKNERLSW